MPISICLIGFGAIAREVCAALDGDTALQVRQVLVRPERRAAVQESLPEHVTAIDSAAEVTADFVLECAGHEAVWTYAAPLLERGVDLGVLSSGALARAGEVARLRAAALAGQARLTVVPGAIGGIDALSAAGAALSDVSYIARKPPLSWRGSPADGPHDLAAITSETVLFSGTAREAALAYPKNANVVATVALAGAGFDATRVTLMADPEARGNSHQIRASGGGYALDFKTSGPALPSNPRTSALTAASALRTLRGLQPGITL